MRRRPSVRRERAKTRETEGEEKFSKQKAEAEYIFVLLNSDKKLKQLQRSQRRAKKSKENHEEVLRVKADSVNRGRILRDLTAVKILGDVDGGSFEKPVRACLGKCSVNVINSLSCKRNWMDKSQIHIFRPLLIPCLDRVVWWLSSV